MAILEILQDFPLRTIAWYGLILYCVNIFVTVVRNLYFHPLSNVPGPWISKVSRGYEFWWDSIHHGRMWVKLPELHAKYGPIIRLGPNEVHIHDLTHFNSLFSFRPLNKHAMAGKQFGISEAIFGTEDYKAYTRKRAAFGDSFSRSSALKLQGLMDEHLEKAVGIMKGRWEEGRGVDLAYIFRGAPADIFTEFIFGQQFNFIDDEESTRGLYHRKHEVIFGLFHLGRHMYFLIPLVLDLLWQNIKQAAGGPSPKWTILGYLSWAQNRMAELKTETNTYEQKVKPAMATFLEGKLLDSDKTNSALSQQGTAVWSGGWETVGTTVTVAAYQILKNSAMQERLGFELKNGWKDISSPPKMNELDSCEYLTAIIKEALRFTPPPGRLSRYNPTSIETYNEYSFPPNTIISVSLPMVLFNPSIWGSDAQEFRPERWLEDKEGKLDQWLVTFSQGTRVCPGLEIAWVEMRLLLAYVFRRFEVSMDGVVSEDDVMTYRDGFTGICKNWCQRLPVKVVPVEI